MTPLAHRGWSRVLSSRGPVTRAGAVLALATGLTLAMVSTAPADTKLVEGCTFSAQAPAPLVPPRPGIGPNFTFHVTSASVAIRCETQRTVTVTLRLIGSDAFVDNAIGTDVRSGLVLGAGTLTRVHGSRHRCNEDPVGPFGRGGSFARDELFSTAAVRVALPGGGWSPSVVSRSPEVTYTCDG